MRIAAIASIFTLGLVGLARAQQNIPSLDWGEFRWERDRGTTSGAVNGSADSVFAFLQKLAKDWDLTIKKEDADPANHEFLVRRQRLVRTLGKERLSRYLSCGEGMTGPNADSWYVYLTLHVALAPAGPTKSKFQMAANAEAVDVPGGRSEKVFCTTTGVLEYEIVNRLRKAFPASS